MAKHWSVARRLVITGLALLGMACLSFALATHRHLYERRPGEELGFLFLLLAIGFLDLALVPLAIGATIYVRNLEGNLTVRYVLIAPAVSAFCGFAFYRIVFDFFRGSRAGRWPVIIGCVSAIASFVAARSARSDYV